MLEKYYQPELVEDKIYEAWENAGDFKPSNASNGAYSIVIPPPNVTGTLHMGHALNNTLQDILIRFNRMQGKSVLWQPGTDHAGIATEMVVERELKKRKINKNNLSRNEFVEHVWEWKNQSGNQIINQLKRLGCSCDWSRERFTLDEGLSDAVRYVFVTLYNDGLIYKDKRLSNWDPKLKTTISDLEVIQKEVKGSLWYIDYEIENANKVITVATTRPETMLGDTAIAVHPEDERYKDVIGKYAILPIVNRRLIILADEYAKIDQGSGAVKITPAHDFNDYELGRRHNLEVINIFDENAKLNDNCPKKYAGLDRFEARKKIVADLDSMGALNKVEENIHTIPYGDRSGEIIEPFLTDQWFVNAKELSIKAIEKVKEEETKFVPNNWKKTYFEWMENIQPWCISRQLMWGHQIPAWYASDGTIFVADNSEEANLMAKKKYGKEVKLTQDSDVLDTWFSSALWPFSTLGWPNKTQELEKFYPTSSLVTGFDIIFFWVARMMMMGLYFTKKVPFHEVYVHALVRDEKGQKMSKSKGNIIDPLDLIYGIELDDLLKKRTSNLMQEGLAEKIERKTRKQFPNGIESYGSDAVRMTFFSLATHTRDISFELGRLKGYRNFCNKIWNAARFINNYPKEQDKFEAKNDTDKWIEKEFNDVSEQITKNVEEYRLDFAMNEVYEFFWGKFCDKYIEDCKASGETANLHPMLKKILILMHPFAPFITEEVNELIFDDGSLMD